MEEKTMKENLVFEGKILKIYKDEIEDCYKNPGFREVVSHTGGVGVLAIDEKENILLVKQYRYAIKKALLEIPAGTLDLGENPLECGKRELVEETGFTASHFESIGDLYPSPGYTSEKIYLFFANDLTFVGQDFDPGEYVELVKMPLDEAYKMVLSNEIEDAKTQIAILKAYSKLKGTN